MENSAFKPVLSLGFRYGDDGVGKWNLDLGDLIPALTVAHRPGEQGESALIMLSRFDTHDGHRETLARGVPVRRVGEHLVCTVFDLMLAQYGAHRQILLDPTDPEVIAGARAEGISDEWIEAAQQSPVYALINCRVARPLHPEFRTRPDGLVHPSAVTGRGRGQSRRPRRGGCRQPVRRARGAAHPDSILGRVVQRG